MKSKSKSPINSKHAQRRSGDHPARLAGPSERGLQLKLHWHGEPARQLQPLLSVRDMAVRSTLTVDALASRRRLSWTTLDPGPAFGAPSLRPRDLIHGRPWTRKGPLLDDLPLALRDQFWPTIDIAQLPPAADRSAPASPAQFHIV